MKWNKRNRWTVIVAACITALFVIWLWGFTHQEPLPEKPETAKEQPEAEPEAQEEPEQDSGSRYLPSSEESAKEQPERTPEPSLPDHPEPEESEESPAELEPEPEKPSEKDAPNDGDVPDWKSGWKEPEWPEWPEWSERKTIPRRTVTGTVGSVPRWDDR